MRTLIFVIPRLALFFGKGIGHTILLWLQCSYFYAIRKYLGVRKPFLISVAANAVPFSVSLVSHHDLVILWQHFIEGEYAYCPMDDPQVIVDLGAHFGDTALYYHTRFPQAKIIAVEPSPDSFARLSDNTATISAITCVQAALGTSDGTVSFHVHQDSQGSSVLAQEASDSVVTVPQRTLASILSEFGVRQADIIKFDIEGAETALATDNPEALSRFYIGEFHPDLTNLTVDEFMSRFVGADTTVEPVGNKGRSIVSAFFV